jgi:hypothetical protein
MREIPTMPTYSASTRLLVATASLSLLAGAHCTAETSTSESSTEGVTTSSSGPVHPFASASLCLDVVNQSTANGAAVQVWACNANQANQQWTYDGAALRVYGSKCLDVTGGSTTNGTKLQIWDCVAGSTNQAFTRSGNTLQWSGKGKCVDLTGGAAVNGTPIQSWSCVAGDVNQEWTLAASGGNSSSGGTSSSGGGTGGASSGGASSGGSSGSGSSSGGTTSTGSDYAPYFPTWVWGSSGYAFKGLVDLQKKSGLNEVTIAFVLSNGGCNTTQDIEDNASDVKAFVAAGGHVKASFGGESGAYVESKCASASAFASAIESFVDATGITDLDFDIEQGPMLTDAVNTMRGQALQLAQASKGIKVAFTLQDNPPPGGGLTSQGESVVSHAIAAGVKISHVNLMTMDFYDGKAVISDATGSLTNAHTQLLSLVPGISSAGAWAMLGAIPMIGKNDDGAIFSLADAQTLATFAKQNGLGLMSFWSIDRDQPGSDFNNASTVQTTDFAFNAILGTVR